LRAISIASAYVTDEKSDNNAAGSNNPAPGRSMTMTPTKPMITAEMRRQPIDSPRMGTASAIANRGTVKKSATASAKGRAGKAM
jgi:hypothetical protein